MDRHATDLPELDVRLPQRLVDYGQQALQMGTCRHLGYDTAETRVQIGLRSDHVRQDCQFFSEDCGGGFIAGSLNTEKIQADSF